jgi:hypothetical protein
MDGFSNRIAGSTLSRRQFAVGSALAGAGLFMPLRHAGVFADGHDFSGLDLPTLDITVTADSYEGVPESLEAGRYLLTVNVNEDAGEWGGGAAFIQPADMTGDEFIAMMSEMDGPPMEGMDATPMAHAEMDATPVDGEEDMGMPAFLFDSVMAGGAFAGPGESAQVVLDLTPGSWVVYGEGPSMQAPVALEVTGEMPTDLVEPESAATLTMSEYDIQVTEGELSTGSYVVRVDNIGAQPHFIVWVQVPDGLTEEQVQEVLDLEAEAMMTGTPPAYGDFNPDEDIIDERFTATQSTGTSQWIMVEDVQAGTHVLICFYPDLSDGRSHADHGMYRIVEIAE